MIPRFPDSGRYGIALAALAWSLAGAVPAVAVAAASPAAAAPAAAAEVRDQKMEALSERLFPALSAVGASAEAVGRLRAQAGLRDVLARRADRADACAGDPLCMAEAALWQADEAAALAGAVAARAHGLLEEPGLVPDDGIEAGIRRAAGR